MINYIKNLFKDKEFEENQKKLAKLKPSLDAIADRKLKKAQDAILKTKEKYQSVFGDEFEFMGVRHIPYSITTPDVNIEVCESHWVYMPMGKFPKIFEFRYKNGNKYLSEKTCYVNELGVDKISCFTKKDNQVVNHHFMGKDEIDTIIKYLERNNYEQ